MKKLIFILLLFSACTTARKSTKQAIIVLDASASKVVGGDGKGHITKWEWTQIAGKKIPISNPTLPVVTGIATDTGTYLFKLKVLDNRNNSDSAIHPVKVKDN